MSFFARFFKRKGGIISDEMRAKSLEIRQQNAKIAQLESQLELKTHLKNLQAMIEDVGGEKTDPMEAMFMQTVMTALLNGKTPGAQPQTSLASFGASTMNSPNPNPEVRDPGRNAAIAGMLKGKIPQQYIAELSNLSDDELLDIRDRIVGGE